MNSVQSQPEDGNLRVGRVMGDIATAGLRAQSALPFSDEWNMTDQDIIDTIAEAARRRTRYPTDEAAQSNAAGILAALRSAGYAIVKLPEPHSVTDNTAGWPSNRGWAVSRNVGIVLTDPVALLPDDARDFAAAILAAADAAEEGK